MRPSIETLRELVRYEPETGKLFWLPRTPDLFLVPKSVPIGAGKSKYVGVFASKTDARTARDAALARVGRFA